MKRDKIYTMSKKFLVVIAGLSFSIIVSIGLVVFLMSIGIFAMGCGASCGDGTFLTKMFLLVAGVVIVLAGGLFLLFKYLLKITSKNAAALVISLIFLGILASPIFFRILDNYSEIGAKKVSDRMNAPFYDARKFHPRVTLVKVIDRLDENGQVVTTRAKFLVSSAWSGDVEIYGGLHKSVESKVMNSPEISSSKIIKIGIDQVELDLDFVPSYVEKGVKYNLYPTTIIPNEHDILGVSFVYRPNPADYGPDASLLYNPIDDVRDSGYSNYRVIDAEVDRTIFYQIR